MYKYGILIIILITLFGCDDSTGPSSSEGASGVVFVTENIDTPTTWSGDTVYVINKYDFYVTSTLTIQPGTVVKFQPEAGPYCILSGAGIINAEGLIENPIIFTSYRDDSHGGDTNEDGTATSPSSKDWGEINTNNCNGSNFNYCYFYYGGSVNFNSTLRLSGDNFTVQNCIFAYNDGSSAHVGALDASYAGASSQIHNNIFYGNVRPLSISTDFNIDDSNSFHNPTDQTEINDYNGIFIYSDDIDSHITWAETEVPFVIDDVDFWIESTYTLTLSSNVTLKFMPQSVMVLADGESAIINHADQTVFFTSYRDDNLKGDTNGDGSTTIPTDGDWVGIYDDSGTTPYPYFFTWYNVLYDSY